jgi:hypothetical protein
VLPDGHVVGARGDGKVLVWDPGFPNGAPTLLGRHGDEVPAVAVLSDGRVVSDARVDFHRAALRVWAPARPDDDQSNSATACSGGMLSRWRISDPANPGTDAIVLGNHDYPVGYGRTVT